jgi:hypothetical protein
MISLPVSIEIIVFQHIGLLVFGKGIVELFKFHDGAAEKFRF